MPSDGQPTLAEAAADALARADIPALGIPFMFERDAAVISADPTNGTPIRVEVRSAAEAFLRSHPTVSGQILNPDEALEAGRRVFGPAGILSAYVERGDACCTPGDRCGAAVDGKRM